MAETMKAWQLASPGIVEQQLHLNPAAARPTTADLQGQDILVQVSSAAVNPADYKVAEMGFVVRAVFSFPKTLGMDLSGVVVGVGPAVTDVLVGDHVVGRLDPFRPGGALSEQVVLQRAGYAKLARDADLGPAAGLGTAALTAYQSIQPHVQAGDRVFINGGSGGTGTFGIQIAKLLGCHVTATCSTAKVALCRQLGADEVVDYKTTDVLAALQKAGPVYSVFVDNVGAVALHAKSAAFLLPTAPFVSVGGGSLGHVASVACAMVRPACLGGGRNRFISYLTKNNHEDLDQLAQWYSKGSLKSVVDATFAFDEAPAAYSRLKKGSSAGKVIVHVAKNA
ncbi:reticulon-4-interacting protein 1 [Cordyceps militaris CM01]|uniref:Reticulon-4-interacting protein 1 n=1 Tax=Cordyceps militaris (strain CM01) TaxID=983644 RepID=G3JCL5_CORMM|nr:reticulon-4-interacting protein 1 [Cordyceps militaris CM01]EGX93827.1 reticulon-4-interacting protein 1 [Cordyceps militaris CM01]